VNLKREVLRGIEKGEFKLHYHPIIELATDRIAGHEALIRWYHPEDVLRSPCDFIPQCEADPSIMVEICEFVVRQSSVDREFLEGDFVSVNISPSSLAQNRFWKALEASVLVGDRPTFFLEITERSLCDYEVIKPYFIRTRETGVGAFVDDFGIAESSFLQVAQVLKMFPSNDYVMVKLDISFANSILDTNYRWFAQSIISSMKNCPTGEIGVIVEGIENGWQRDAFLQLGAQYGQGWLWGRPMPIEVLNTKMSSHKKISS
jgi:sensor c-di-GMP phosphodiesterase-like protein